MAGEEVDIIINAGALSDFLTKIVQPYLLNKAHEIADEARRSVPNGATSELRDSIRVERGAKGGVAIKVDAAYAGFVEQGTGPQHQPEARAQYFPRVRRRGLILWSESKGLNPYQVAHGISINGTPANPFLENSIAKVLGRFQFRWISKQIKEI